MSKKRKIHKKFNWTPVRDAWLKEHFTPQAKRESYRLFLKKFKVRLTYKEFMNRCEAVCPKYSKPSTKGGNYNYNYKEYTTHYKREKGCLVCGITNSCILDFHHIDPSVKSFTLGKVIKPSLEILKEEISKCVVLCSNHHRLHHYDTTFDLKPYINEWLLNNKGGNHD